MVLGTSSSAGKSLIAAGLCRCLFEAGVRVAPFKAQNMSNNAAVTEDGGEIGRAQALQARACGLAPHSDMNPVLLKPTGSRTSQVVVQGKVLTQCDAGRYHTLADELWPRVTASFDRLAKQYDVLVMEGAGSCAELNLAWDFTNLKMARYAEADCLLVGDIDRGGIFAQLIGTLALLSDVDRARFGGTIINKFRGNIRLLDEAVTILESRSGFPVLGVLPFLDDLHLDEEDSLDIPVGARSRSTLGRGAPEFANVIVVDVLRLPHISNFTDFTPLGLEPDVIVRYVDVLRSEPLDGADVVIIPGSKNTLEDLETLRRLGYVEQIREVTKKGAEIIGICGGLQMMGRRIEDPHGVESELGSARGMGLLPLDTELLAEKTTQQTSGIHAGLGVPFSGYEIHCGETGAPVSGASGTAVAGTSAADGCHSDSNFLMTDHAGRAVGFGSNKAWGTYVHGIFEADEFRHAWLRRCRIRKGLVPDDVTRQPYRPDQELNRVASLIRQHLCLPEPWAGMMGVPPLKPRS